MIWPSWFSQGPHKVDPVLDSCSDKSVTRRQNERRDHLHIRTCKTGRSDPCVHVSGYPGAHRPKVHKRSGPQGGV
jgi:hypothetical protein